MECEMEDVEFDYDNVVDDVVMSEDELEKELKEIEKENKDSLLEKPVKELVEEKPCKQKENTKEERSHHKDDLGTLPDDHYNDGRHRGYYDNDSKGYTSKPRHRCDMYREGKVDYKRLNKSLHVSKSSDPGIIGREIAYRLHEPKTGLFGHVVRVLGFTMTSEIFAETKEIVKRGGLKTDRGDRVRSPGGTFLYVMKNRCYATPEQIKEIFKDENETKKQNRKRKNQWLREAEKEGLDKKIGKDKKRDITKVKEEKPTEAEKNENGIKSHGHKEIGREVSESMQIIDASHSRSEAVIKSEGIDPTPRGEVVAKTEELDDELEEGELSSTEESSTEPVT